MWTIYISYKNAYSWLNSIEFWNMLYWIYLSIFGRNCSIMHRQFLYGNCLIRHSLLFCIQRMNPVINLFASLCVMLFFTCNDPFRIMTWISLGQSQMALFVLVIYFTSVLDTICLWECNHSYLILLKAFSLNGYFKNIPLRNILFAKCQNEYRSIFGWIGISRDLFLKRNKKM